MDGMTSTTPPSLEQPSPGADEGDDNQGPTPSLSKRAAKREARRQQFEDSWVQHKAAKKQAKKEAKQRNREAQQAAWEALPAEEQEACRREAQEARAAREARQAAAPATSTVGPTCVIDCDFDALMLDREVTSLVQQLMYAYGANRRAAIPLDFHLTSVSGRIEAGLRKIDGFSNWKVTSHATSHLDVFERERLVYLSSEGTETLWTLDPTKVYVIGGLVDHNRLKGLTHERAVLAGIATARLPIDEHMQMSQRRVLAVNHVFDILLHYANHGDWTVRDLGIESVRVGRECGWGQTIRDLSAGVEGIQYPRTTPTDAWHRVLSSELDPSARPCQSINGASQSSRAVLALLRWDPVDRRLAAFLSLVDPACVRLRCSPRCRNDAARSS